MEHLISTWGYLAIFLLSIAQSACVPTSSELTFGFAGFLAYTGHFNIVEVVAVGAMGELIGAYIAWAFGITGGRALVLRYGKYIRVDHQQLDRLQAWYERHPRWGVFASRLLPVVRNFVALAAGLAEVPPLAFGVLTLLGSLVWDGGLTLLGYSVGSAWQHMVHTVSDAGYAVVVLVVIVAAFLVIAHRKATGSHRRVRDESAQSTRESVHSTKEAVLAPTASPSRADYSDPTGYLSALSKLARAKAVIPDPEAPNR
ncbi:DedA family protein [Ferrimicrobium sp.]|uniref:DedA family protein n=1 Tax=Ferrimicrobium sp. TaxID=2926050 RepID=UPI0026094527|nr:DedA family protein [Ferrimicrobium sp.]